MPDRDSVSGRPTRHYRVAFWLFGGYFLLGVIVAVVLLLAITDANAGYPSLFFAGVFAAAGLPVFAVAAVFAGKSLARREPHRVAMLAVLAVSILFAWTLVTRIVHIVWSQLT